MPGPLKRSKPRNPTVLTGPLPLYGVFIVSFCVPDARRPSRVLVEGPGDGRADHAAPAGPAVPRPGVRRLPGVHQN